MKVITYEDRELVEMIRNGGRDLEKVLVHLTNQEKKYLAIRKLTLGMGAKQEEYEEIFNDTLVALHSSIVRRRFNEEYSINAYMYGIARKLWYKRWSKQKLNPTSLTNPVEDKEPSIEVEIITKERRMILIGFIEKLGTSCRKILIKAYIEEFKNRELVEIMNYKNEGVVRKKKSQCLKRLVDMFKEKPELLKQLKL